MIREYTCILSKNLCVTYPKAYSMFLWLVGINNVVSWIMMTYSLVGGQHVSKEHTVSIFKLQS
jgi:hypothetical protein